ncbi:hypothetical protein [Pseudoxanthomonas japonensis]|uniref:hypothetical protein n=1 Tax=Pseudoxanthomonas japonensis TaxID=69284 RepID=UPI001BCC997D|nr:hypothetical protein [Pseudoxanthomonas japonensis]
MTNAIQVLERMGAAPVVGMQSLEAYFRDADVTDQERTAILTGDVDMLNDVFGARAQMVCAIFAPENEPFKENGDEEGDRDGREDEQEEQAP